MCCFSCTEQINKHQAHILKFTKLLLEEPWHNFFKFRFPPISYLMWKRWELWNHRISVKIEWFFWMFGIPLARLGKMSPAKTWRGSVAVSSERACRAFTDGALGFPRYTGWPKKNATIFDPVFQRHSWLNTIDFSVLDRTFFYK